MTRPVRAGRRARSDAAATPRAPYITRRIPPYEVLGDAGEGCVALGWTARASRRHSRLRC